RQKPKARFYSPLWRGVLRTANARSAGVVRAACHAWVVSAFNCVNYYIFRFFPTRILKPKSEENVSVQSAP
ncbi:MAG: hypothetical protein LBI31_05255, partial [Zoogloeaceae bacterium]|nr:hypothetical protein [Zoogloeaceae bacterium]